VFSSPSNQSLEDLLNNPLIREYTSPISYTHKGVERKIYERTEQSLLILKDLKDYAYAFSKIVEGVTMIPAILPKLVESMIVNNARSGLDSIRYLEHL